MIIQRAIATGILCIMQGIAYGIVILAFFFARGATSETSR